MGNTQTNQQAEDALDPNKNGFIDTLDPTKNGLVNTLDPTKNGLANTILNDPNIKSISNNATVKQVFKNINPNNINGIISQLTNELSPQHITHTINNINPKEITTQIINDPNLNKIIKPIQPTLQPIVKQTVNPIVDNLPTDLQINNVVDSGIKISNQVGSAINNVLSPSFKSQKDNSMIYLIIGGILIGIYLFIPDKKKLKSNY